MLHTKKFAVGAAVAAAMAALAALVIFRSRR
jgi:hypothetical protein